MGLFSYAVAAWLVSHAVAGPVRQDDICGVTNGRRLYLEQGERGVLTARNISTSLRHQQQGSLQSHEQCSLEVVTCPSCVIVVRFRHLALSPQCGGGLMDAPCRCDYLWLSEPPYDDVSGTPFCGHFPPSLSPPVFRSQTRTLVLALLFSQAHKHAFTLEYSSERNRQHLVGKPSSTAMMGTVSNSSVGGIITSPFFPSQYPRDLGAEYIISCEADAGASCRVRLLFNDFQLAGVSIMEFYDWNGQRIEVSSGALFRPPAIITSGPSLLVRFYANGGSSIGYKASYSFISGNYDEKAVEPITDCGGYVENLGGAITMMNMVERGGSIKSYDCIWLIRPPTNFYHLKTHIYLKVSTFLDMAGSTELVVRQGLTSEGPILETVRHPVAQLGPAHARTRRENILPLNVGFYVSLRGTFSSMSRLAIVYTAFTYMDCFTGSDYLCQNHRCIPAQLHCDGFDHCGDNSDEPDTCTREWDAEPVDRRWYSHTPNYYFPKMERYPDLKTATLVFVISSLGLILLIAALVVLLYRMGARARQQRELQNRLQTISELLDGARIEEVAAEDEPPVYEAPPDYEEVIKRKGSQKRKKIKNRRPRSTSAPRTRGESPAAVSMNQHMDVTVPAASTPLLPTTSVNRSCQVTPLPESPPPPYSENHITTPAHSLRPDETVEVLNWEEQTLRAFSNTGHSNVTPSTILTIEAEPSQAHVDEHSLISIDCNLYESNNYDNSIPPTINNSNVAVSTIDESLIFKRRLHRTPRKRKGFSLDIDTLTRLYPETECSCEGACNCHRPVSADPQVRTRSTWSPASYTLHALDIYFDKLERGSRARMQDEQSPLKLSKNTGLALSISMSVDNLREIV
ncbi:uncharacterized protein LOC128985784 isoform X1 [Macrosteles quadrilineatus]|uniref:uncharacterized protein LOC128985784 isoform X1 n=2 Tax=Macrosteles quadrilineatus TaxID=74068 RepID=UPI0023E18B22|nr:uncharacterized protein LOC128985784 isoform X1 [Macrosteles quadrilineatus]